MTFKTDTLFAFIPKRKHHVSKRVMLLIYQRLASDNPAMSVHKVHLKMHVR